MYDEYEEFSSEKDEKVFDKIVKSPFKDTGLLEYLTEKQIKQVYKYYIEFMWKGRYADCISIEEALGLMSNI